jgi:hypothetical protein
VLPSNVSQTGNIASLVVQSKWKKTFSLDTQSAAEYANTKGWIVSIATSGAVFGCIGVSLTDHCIWNGYANILIDSAPGSMIALEESGP